MLEMLFVYGTLKEKEIQKQVIGRVIENKITDVLEGYSMKEIKIGGKKYPIIFQKNGFAITGYIIQITGEELGIVDRYEGSSYKREKIKLVSGKEAWTYIENEGI